MTDRAFLDADGVRAAGLDALDRAAAPGWVREALATGAVTVHHGVQRWHASEGEFTGHRVTLAVDAGALARLHVDPAARELLHVALCGAGARRARESVVDAAFAWDGSVVLEGDGYRQAVRARRPATAGEALRAWCDAVAPTVASGGEVELAEGVALVRGPRPEAAARAVVALALRALCDAREVRWRGASG